MWEVALLCDARMKHRKEKEDCEACPDSKAMVAQIQRKNEALAGQGQVAKQAAAPPTPEDVGRSTWTFLHSFAANYPEKADDTTQQHAMALLRAMGVVYPCKWCRDDWQQELHKQPPPVQSRAELEQWMCNQHNAVNSKLGKPAFDCSTVHDRWAIKKQT